ncbi:MAG: hypothetical protein ABI446_06010 [Gemmatimonadaceae bacterium]
MRTHIAIVRVAIVAASLAACSHATPPAPARATPSPQAPHPAPPTPLSAPQLSARNTLLAADSALSLAASHSLHDAIAAGAATDIVMLMPALSRVGTRDSVLSSLDSLNAITTRTLSWHPIRAELSADGTRGYTYGYGRRVAHSDTLTSVAPIQYLSYWRKEADGWKLAAWLISAGRADAPATAPAECANPGAPTYTASHDSSAIATVRAADLDFSARSVKSGAGPAFGEYVSFDGASIGTGASEITCGRDAIQKSLAPLGPGVLTWAPRVADAAPSGDLAFTSGDAIIKEGSDVSYSNYLTIWKRQADGTWRFVADGGNSSPRPANLAQ